MVAGGARIYVQTVELIVVHHFENVAVTAHKQAGAGIAQHLRHPRGVTSRIAAHMSHEHTRALGLKLLDKWKIAAALAGVDIAVDSPYHRAHLLETADDVDAADVAGVPDFVAVGEMVGKPFVPAGCLLYTSDAADE